MKDNKPKDADQFQTVEVGNQPRQMERDDLTKLPMEGKVQAPYNHPYDRHELPKFDSDQTDRAVIKHIGYRGFQIAIQKKLSGREYTYRFSDAQGQEYANTFVDRENRGDQHAFGILLPQATAAVDYIISMNPETYASEAGK